jgi:hypothetical protein
MSATASKSLRRTPDYALFAASPSETEPERIAYSASGERMLTYRLSFKLRWHLPSSFVRRDVQSGPRVLFIENQVHSCFRARIYQDCYITLLRNEKCPTSICRTCHNDAFFDVQSFLFQIRFDTCIPAHFLPVVEVPTKTETYMCVSLDGITCMHVY